MPKIVLLDGYSLIYRAYHALVSAGMDDGHGLSTNAIHGFMMMLLNVLRDEKPDALAVAFDMHEKTFRHESYAEYKAGRSPMPEDMRPQIPKLREILQAMNVAVLECPGYEADDIVGTVSQIGEDTGNFDTLIVTGDRDSYQLAGPRTAILYTKTGTKDTERVTQEWVREKYGVSPAQMIDVKALMGDKSDNIPGIDGIGEKTALKLIAQYGNLAAVLDNAEKDQKGKLRERLMEGRKSAEMSRFLAEINRHSPVEFSFDACRLGDMTGAYAILRDLRMKSVLSRLQEIGGEEKQAAAQKTEIAVVQAVDVNDMAARIASETDKSVISVYSGEMFYVSAGNTDVCLPFGGDLLSPGVSEEECWQALSGLLDGFAWIVAYDVKKCPLDLEKYLPKLRDVMLSAYVIDAQMSAYSLSAIAEQAGVYLQMNAPARAMREIDRVHEERIQADDLQIVEREIELPLAFALREMENIGFLTDAEALKALGVQFSAEVARLSEEIYAMAGEKVNLNSPKQLGELLFGRMGIKGGKKGKSGYSTNADTLEALADDYPICRKILDYRKVFKLNSTYIEALLRLRGADGRIHTQFDQVSTATGRISSLEPNLQNIPVRTEMGKEIRRAFVAPEGSILVDADYSQIELRVLAAMSGDGNMQDAFIKGEDIHRRTAAEVYGVGLEEVTGQMRSNAKAVNFGIVYGISDFGLAKNIGVSRQEAKSFIETYFARYPAIRKYMDGCVQDGREDGYAITLLGRRRYLKELSSSNFNIRAFGERAAMNSPIQGTAADIIKLAMVKVRKALSDGGYRAKLILQVHDELIIECPKEEADAVGKILVDSMEHVIALDVPLKADLSTGGNWYECK